MNGRPRPLRRPVWVTVALLGLPGRTSAWAFFWLSLVLAAAGVVGGFVWPPLFAGGLFVLAALWYWAAIRWMDRHEAWPPGRA